VRAPRGRLAELVDRGCARPGSRRRRPRALLNPTPAAVWVQPRTERPTLAAAGTLVVWLYLIVANTETDRAMALLDDASRGCSSWSTARRHR
jgi:hypothetical protein